MKGIIYPRPNKHNDLTYYYDSEKTGYINTAEGRFPYKGVITAVKEVDSRTWFSNILRELENHKETKFLAMAWSQIYYRAEVANTHIFKATAYCALEDTFDLKIGMKTARNKVNDKYLNSWNTYLSKVRTNLYNADEFLYKMYL